MKVKMENISLDKGESSDVLRGLGESKGKLKLLDGHLEETTWNFHYYCVVCSARVTADDTFCSTCGNKVDEKTYTTIEKLLGEISEPTMDRMDPFIDNSVPISTL